MTTPGTTSRQLLLALAVPPGDNTPGAEVVDDIGVATEEIRRVLATAEHERNASIGTATAHRWRTTLDSLLSTFESTLPVEWALARRPGSWLDSLLRLRSLLAHEVGKAYWEERTHIKYEDIDVERYLWGAR